MANKTKTKTILSAMFLGALVVGLFVFSPAPASASLVPCATTEHPEPCTLCHLIVGIQGLIQYGFTIVAILALVAIFFAGTMYILASGDEGMMTKAKGFLKSALIGFAVVFLGWLTVNLTLYVLSANENNLGLGVGTTWYEFTCDKTSSVPGAPAPDSAVIACPGTCILGGTSCDAGKKLVSGTDCGGACCQSSSNADCGAGGKCKYGPILCPDGGSKIDGSCSADGEMCCK